MLHNWSFRRSKSQLVVSLIFLLASQLTSPLTAHDAVDDQIARVTAQITVTPTSADLLVRRAELYRESHRRNEALADLNRAEALEPAQPKVDFVRAAVFLDAGRPRAAIAAIDRFLERRGTDALGAAILARARVALGQYSEADAAFVRALALSPLPELYIERSRALAASGSEGLKRAVQALDEGIARLGPIVTLELEAIDLNLVMRQYEAALSRLDRVAAQASRQEQWLARRGAILEKAGRASEARATYEAALTAISALPSWTQATRATATLRARLQHDVARLSARPKPQTRNQ